MMQDEDMRQELAQGSFDLDRTTQRVVEVSPARARWVALVARRERAPCCMGGVDVEAALELGARGCRRRAPPPSARPPSCHVPPQTAAGGQEGRLSKRRRRFVLPCCSASSPVLLPPVLQEGRKDASPEAADRADDKDVKDAARSRVVSQSQTS